MGSTQAPKVAIVCDWLTGIGGAERVVLQLHKLFPDAPIYTSQYNPEKIDWFKDADVRTTWLQKLPSGLKKFLPLLRIVAFSTLNLKGYDLVISSSGAEAKGVRTPKKTLHINYCHSPTHYYWSRYDSYIKNPNFPTGFNWLARITLRVLVGPLRHWDKRAAQRPQIILVNSRHIQAQVKKYYGRDSQVVPPPVDNKRFATTAQRVRSGFVVTGRQVAYKRIDLAVRACSELGLPLKVIGNGPEHHKLVSAAGPTVEFLTNVSDADMPYYFQTAEAFLFPGLDDFGITPVEAMAAGTPIIAYQAGGALDYVVPSKTGIFMKQQSVKGLKEALENFKTVAFDPKIITKASQQFSPEAFNKHIADLINQRIK